MADATPERDEVRRITDLETLRLLADPLKLAILGAFPGGDESDPVSVKELAARIGKNQTRLYRHVKQLEEAGLLRVAQTRVVSGIIEKRYRTTYRKLVIASALLDTEQSAAGFEQSAMAVLGSASDLLRGELRGGTVPLDPPAEGPDLSLHLSDVRVRMTPERYARVRDEIAGLVEREAYSDETPDALPVTMLTLMYSTQEKADRP